MPRKEDDNSPRFYRQFPPNTSKAPRSICCRRVCPLFPSHLPDHIALDLSGLPPHSIVYRPPPPSPPRSPIITAQPSYDFLSVLLWRYWYAKKATAPPTKSTA